MKTTPTTPSARARAMLAEAKRLADREVQRHLDAGRFVYGRRNGKPVVIDPIDRVRDADATASNR